MKTIKLTKEETRDIEDNPDFELIEDGDWEVDGKYQLQTSIYRQVSTGKFYSCSIHRSGSPFTDYYYSWEDEGAEMYEVEKVVKTIETWEADKLLQQSIEAHTQLQESVKKNLREHGISC